MRSFSEAVAEEVKGTGVTVTALCPGPTATGFEQAASMGQAAMFKNAAKAEDIAKEGIDAMFRGKVLCYCGPFSKRMHVLSQLVPRSVTRRASVRLNK